MNTISFKTSGPSRRLCELRLGQLFEHEGRWYSTAPAQSGIDVETGELRFLPGLLVRAASTINGDRFAVVEYLERDPFGEVKLNRVPFGDWPTWAYGVRDNLGGAPAFRPVIQRAPGHRDAAALMRRVGSELSARLYRGAVKVAGWFRVPPIVFTVENLRPETFDDIAWILLDAARRLREGKLKVGSGGIRVDNPNGGLAIESNLVLEEVAS